MAKIVVPILVGALLSGCTILRPNRWPKGSGKIVLTFDDGPTRGEGTARLLDVLAKHRVKATFCLIGRNVTSNSPTVRRLVEEGHVVGNHTYSHRIEIFSSRSMDGEITRDDEAIGAATGKADFRTRLFRPPCGLITPAVAWSREAKSREQAYLTFYANDAGVDAAGAPKLMARVKKRLLKDGGGAVVFHEMRYVAGSTSEGPTKEWLPAAIDDLIVWAKKNGLKFGTYPNDERKA
ncbi:hypothetical protein BH09VER1_BH09VER1_21270 [soil metagenome]